MYVAEMRKHDLHAAPAQVRAAVDFALALSSNRNKAQEGEEVCLCRYHVHKEILNNNVQ